MSRVMVTGGTGFIGHHMIDYLLKNTDHEIVILDRLDFFGKLEPPRSDSELGKREQQSIFCVA